jgi:HSP20 family molecular chaperone IbpA
MDGKRGYGPLDFERAFDEFFDELLIDRWHCGVEVRESTRAQVSDLRDRYELHMAVPSAHAEQIEIEVTELRIAVRVPDDAGRVVERIFAFAESIDRDTTNAHWADGVLTIVVPKRKARRIKLSGT